MRYQYKSKGFKNDFYGYRNHFKLNIINIIIAVNVIIFFLFAINKIHPFNNIFTLSSNNFHVWQLLTYMFLHGDLLHIGFNMYLLWMFGKQIESIWGFKKFLIYYLLTGISAGLVSYLFGAVPTIGASGAIVAIITAYAYIFPNRIVSLWFIIPIQMQRLILVLASIEFILLSLDLFDILPSRMNHTAHLTGMLLGYIYLKFGSYFLESFFNFFKIKIIKKSKLSSKKEVHVENVDKILDKLKLEGWDGLTQQEKTKLFQASKKKQKNQHIN